MKLKLGMDTIKETFGEILFIGVEQKFVYDQDKREYDRTKVASTTVNLACDKLDDSFSVVVEWDAGIPNPDIPNVKKWGKVALEQLEYDPFASGSSYEMNGKTQTRGTINERFRCKAVHPLGQGDRIVDDNGVIIEDKGAKKQ